MWVWAGEGRGAREKRARFIAASRFFSSTQHHACLAETRRVSRSFKLGLRGGGWESVTPPEHQKRKREGGGRVCSCLCLYVRTRPTNGAHTRVFLTSCGFVRENWGCPAPQFHAFRYPVIFFLRLLPLSLALSFSFCTTEAKLNEINMSVHASVVGNQFYRFPE